MSARFIVYILVQVAIVFNALAVVVGIANNTYDAATLYAVLMCFFQLCLIEMKDLGEMK
jgi:hypothetical protein